MKIRFIRPPRHLWPFNSERSAFWPPLAFAALAAYLRRSLTGLDIRIIDCPILKMGWRTIERVLRDDPPDVLCIGEETVSSDEGLRLARLAKSINPALVVIAGGCHYPYVPEHAFGLADRNVCPTVRAVDFIVCSEGEETLVELIRVLRSGGDPATVRGIICPGTELTTCNLQLASDCKQRASLSSNLQVESCKLQVPFRSVPRPLLSDLDTLPFPAYDLLPMHLYGRGSRNHPALVAVEHGRGCVDSCSFCILWKQMGKAVRDNGSFRVVPFYRTKSARRSADEVLWLAKHFGRKTIAWVDATWNADPGWSEEFCDRIIASGVKVQMLAWMRADAVVRDEAAGILAKQVRAGLVQAMIGVERASGDEVAALGKHSSGPDVTREAFRILRRNYPSVYTIGTMIYGTPDETPARLKRALKATYELGMDYPLFVPLTPNPGTDLWDDAGTQRRIARRDFRLFNFHTPVMDAEGMSAEELEWFYVKLGLDPSPERPLGIVRGIFGSPARRRSVHRALFGHACEVLWRAAAARIRRRGNGHSPSLYAVKPKWYES